MRLLHNGCAIKIFGKNIRGGGGGNTMAAPKVIVQLYPMMPSDGEDDRRAKRPLGADSELYNKVYP